MDLFKGEKNPAALSVAHRRLVESQDAEGMLELGKNGSLAAMVYLARFYDDTAPNWDAAKKWYALSIEGGYAPSAYSFGRALQQRGEIEEATSAYKIGWELGDLPSGFRLATIYRENGDWETYASIIKSSADSGNLWALRDSVPIYLIEKSYYKATLSMIKFFLSLVEVSAFALVGKDLPYQKSFG